MREWGQIKSSKNISLVLLALLVAPACSYKTPPKETPPPSEFRIPKTFFAEFDGSGNVSKYKTFACGWTPEEVAGRYSSAVFAFYNQADHCNIIFQITETALVGKLINPSFPNNPGRWANVITIPITRHYHFELEKDKYQRPTNRTIENTNRDHWSARPFITIDPKGTRINEWSYDIFWDTHVVDDVVDVEWDLEKNFLGFTIEAHSAFYGSRMQGKFRFNFLAFNHDENFVRTPYSHENARHLNVLHVLGETVNGNRPILYAAKWDVSERRTIYLNNFPPEYVSIATDVIEHWNDAFEQIGKGRPFRVEVRQGKYAFDLRYPGITWVSDKHLSLNAPLGVGMVNADVRNGKTLWGGVTVWGGMLEKIVNSYSPQLHASMMSQETAFEGVEPSIQLALMEPSNRLALPRATFPRELSQTMPFEQIRATLSASFQAKFQALSTLNAVVGRTSNLSDAQRTAALQEILQNQARGFNPLRDLALSDVRPQSSTRDQTLEFRSEVERRMAQLSPMLQANSPALDMLAGDYQRLQEQLAQLGQTRGNSRDFLNANFLQDLIDQPRLQDSLRSFPTNNNRALKQVIENGGRMSRQEMRRALERSHSHSHSASFDSDRRLSDVAFEWNAGLSRFGQNKTLALRSFIKDLLLHEVGHMLGLGHNFKENILPERGSVPAKYLDGPNGLEAKARDNFKNYTTVMGYKNGLTDVLTKYEDLTPGPMDVLVLRYLYNQEYPIFPKEATAEDDFKFVKLESDGIITDDHVVDGREYKARYFEACNDYTASFGNDPFCNRWDRGSDAVSIVRGYFDDYKGNLSSQLYAFANNVRGGSYWMQEYYLWMRSLSTFGRTRLFYDYMRQKYEEKLSAIQTGGDAGVKNMLEFSQACRAEDPSQFPNPVLAELFNNPENRELKELCIASGYFFDQMNSLLSLPGPDSTRIDYFDNYVTGAVFGGDARGNFSRFFGTWKEIARNPIKISALMAITSPNPFVNLGGWLYPVHRYSRQDSSYLMNTFYPKEFAQSIASTVDNNLTLANTSLETRTKIGRSVLSLGYLLMNNFFSNDSLSVDQNYLRNIRSQTEFNYRLVAIEVEAKPVEGRELVRKFSGTIHQMSSRAPESVPEIYMYTNDRTVISPPPRSLLLPLSSLRWYSPSGGYYFAVKMDYPDDYHDRLKSNSVRQTLENMYHQTMRACIQGPNRNGLRYFFNDTVSPTVFPGFTFPATIHTRNTDKNKFFSSLDEQFERYFANAENSMPERPDPKSCEEALRGQGLLVLAASAINGLYLFDLYDYIEKGQQ